MRPRSFPLSSAVVVSAIALAAFGSVAACSADGASDPDSAINVPPTSTTPPARGEDGPVTLLPEAGSDAFEGDCQTSAPSHVCGVAPQCGCSLAETCEIEDNDGNVGCLIAGRFPPGHPCTSTAGCARGLTCIFGTCHAFCPTAGSPCESGSPCVQIESSAGAPIPNLKICRAGCDLRDPSACGGATVAGVGVCVVDEEGMTDCQSGGSRTENQTCSGADLCGPALVCVNIAQSTACKRWCRVGTADCGGGKVCTGFDPAIFVGGAEYGVCP